MSKEEEEMNQECCNPFSRICWKSSQYPNDVLWSPFFLLVFPSLREK